MIAGLRVVPFIVTLGTYTVYRGLATWLASSTTVYVPGDVKPWWFSQIMKIEPEPRWLLVAPGVWVFLALSILVAVALRYSLLGRYIYAVGSNEATARLCGINVPLDQGDRLHDRRPGDGPGRRLAVRLPRARSATRRPPAGSSCRSSPPS